MLNTMKSRFSGKKFIVLLVIITAPLFSQGWNNTVTTSIYDNNFLGMDLFTNRNGNNLVELGWNGNIPAIYYVKYYLLNSSGSIIRSSTIETYGPYQGSIEYVNISGDNDKVYLIYKIGTIIRAKKSTDAGVSWTTHDLTNPLGSGAFYGVDIVFDNITNKLHVVYARGDIGYSNQITHYYALNPDDQWGEYKQVSDYGDEWTKPTVSFSQNRVHVSYHEDGAMSRDKYSTTWQTPVTLSSSSLIERIHAGNSKLFYFYAETQPGLFTNIYVQQRNLDGSSWSSPILLQEYSDFVSPFVSSTNTTDGKTHIVYRGPSSTVYRNYDVLTWSSEIIIGDNYVNPLISSVSNDLFVVWKGSNNYIKYRQYDAVPLMPQNFSATTYNNHPKITWSACNEPDVYSTGSIKVYRGYEDGSGYISWILAATLSGNSTSWVDNNVTLGNKKQIKFYYKISSVDAGNNESPTTTPIMFYGTGPIWKISEDNTESTIKTFSLSQNYPNPFNPTTKISYSLEYDGFVSLKVYDVLGIDVATLVNEHKPAGYYEIEFNALNLPSGMYIYKLQAGRYTDAKKMILSK